MSLQVLLANGYRVILQPIIFLLFAVAFVIFFWGIVTSIRDSEDEKERAKGKQSILWGILGMVIMISVFGIIRIITGTIGVENPPQPNVNVAPNVTNSL
ncbi:hypothetical protein IPJ70_00085 [Candidatus Campbellbacteria bacterium]|nr:MAG: hypothetical protein IPJ70_00085 [Candidatus Campbellbacteria bacterium]